MTETEPDHFEALRGEMADAIVLHTELVAEQLGKRQLNPQVLDVMRQVPRHEFVPAELRLLAYIDSPLPIGFGKTISQPFIVALMTDLLEIGKDDRVLEIGSGLGYHSAVLAQLAGSVFTVEIIEELAGQAETRLKRLGYDNIQTRRGDGSLGWPEHAPFDKILVAAAPELVPPALLNQLKPGGRMVIPAGIEDAQQLMLVEKNDAGRLNMTEILAVRFAALMSGQ
jgi:protein-L-isoaspartate(D-aspartate) O-methyltransferase